MEEDSRNEKAMETTQKSGLPVLDGGSIGDLSAAGLRPRADSGGGERQVDPERGGAAQRADLVGERVLPFNGRYQWLDQGDRGQKQDQKLGSERTQHQGQGSENRADHRQGRQTDDL